MPIKGFIGPEPVSTPVEYKRLRATGGELPDDLLREASSRLGITALLVAALWVIGDTAGWTAPLARLYYLTGAVLVVGYLALGQLYLLFPDRIRTSASSASSPPRPLRTSAPSIASSLPDASRLRRVSR